MSLVKNGGVRLGMSDAVRGEPAHDRCSGAGIWALGYS